MRFPELFSQITGNMEFKLKIVLRMSFRARSKYLNQAKLQSFINLKILVLMRE